ncbi:MAG: guanylate kinase [Lachnospiraceae bacterium]|nr:guanylate kinase [Lachnospiraceae bacterium]
MSDKGILIVLSGLSGAGKGTVVNRLIEKHPGEYVLSISATTRNPREGEVDGREYFFKTESEFESMIKKGDLLEHARYVNNYYGTPKKWVLDQLGANRNVILEIDIQGGFQIKELIPDAVLVFINAPSMEELRHRLEKRGTESAETINERIERGKEELVHAKKYDYVIINVDVEKSVDMLHNIVSVNKEIRTGERNMLHPSYTDLMNAVNGESENAEQPVVQSRYSIVMAASKRARQLVDGAEPLVDCDYTSKPLSVAIDEIYSQKVTILGDDEEK